MVYFDFDMFEGTCIGIVPMRSYVLRKALTSTSEADAGSVKRGGGGRESKYLDAAPENNKNRPKKQKSAEKGGGGAAADSAPPPLDPPLYIKYVHKSIIYLLITKHISNRV